MVNLAASGTGAARAPVHKAAPHVGRPVRLPAGRLGTAVPAARLKPKPKPAAKPKPAVARARPGGAKNIGLPAVPVSRVSIPHPGQPLSPYVNPFAGAKISPARIDMGVDYFGRGNIGAVGPGKITAAGNAWQGAVGAPNPGTWITELITAGPLKGQQVYVAEDVQSLVKTGQTVKAGQPIAQFVAGSGGVHYATETGFAAPGAAGAGGQTMAAYAGQAASGRDPGAVPTAWGIAYAKVLRALKVPTVAIPASGTGSAPSFGIGGKAGRVTLPPSLPPIVVPSGVTPPASGGVPMPPVSLAASKTKVKRPPMPPVKLPGPPTTGTSPPVTITGVTSSTAPPTFINSSTGTGGITPLAQPVASGTTGATSGTSTLLLVAGAGVILVVILMSRKGKK